MGNALLWHGLRGCALIGVKRLKRILLVGTDVELHAGKLPVRMRERPVEVVEPWRARRENHVGPAILLPRFRQRQAEADVDREVKDKKGEKDSPHHSRRIASGHPKGKGRADYREL